MPPFLEEIMANAKNMSVMIKPASSLCNLRCRYCFYADVSSLREVESCGLMTEQVMRAVIDSSIDGLSAGDSVNFAFQGGEPMLAGIEFFKRFVGYVKSKDTKVRVSYALQTNGTMLNDEWCAFLKDNAFLVGLSMDGAAKYHDANRVDASFQGTYKTIKNAKKLLEKHGTDYNILTVLTAEIARHPQKIWQWLKQENIGYVQLIPCLDALGKPPESPYALTPQRFAGFYTQLFKCWLEEFKKGNYISVKLFDDIINLLGKGEVNACGLTGKCQTQLVVEGDGSVYPCDFYALDEYRLGNMCSSSAEELVKSKQANDFLNRDKGDTSVCSGCPYYNICGAGCPRQRPSVCYYKSTDMCGYKSFLDACINDMLAVAKTLR